MTISDQSICKKSKDTFIFSIGIRKKTFFKSPKESALKTSQNYYQTF